MTLIEIGSHPEEFTFLKESNNIEGEFSVSALDDAWTAWKYGRRMRNRVTPDVILEIHRRLMDRVYPSISGKFRHYQAVMIGGEERIAQDAERIRQMISGWVGYYYDSTDDWREAHIAFEDIHPFLDGNGRVGRILMNMQRMRLGLPILTIHTGREQLKYYKWFNE